MKQEFSGKKVLITGGARGIGYAIVQVFCEQGAEVYFTATDAQRVQELQNVFTQQGYLAHGLCLNLLDATSTANFLDYIKKETAIDILINNAGITDDQLALRMSESSWDSVLSVNLTGAFKITQAVLRAMLKQQYGRIINISSVVGASGHAGQVNYCASKAGLIGMTKALALEYAHKNITVNSIAPGFIATEMTDVLTAEQKEAIHQRIPMKKLGQPQDIAHACLYLASEKAHYVTGQTLHVNGGLYLS